MTDTDESEPTDMHRSRRRFLGTAVGGAVVGASTGQLELGSIDSPQRSEVIPQGPTVALEPIATGFSMPTDFAVPPESERRFVLDRPGQVYVVDQNGRHEEPFLDISGRMTPVEGEQGLLGIAFHPKYQKNRKFYLRYSAPPREETPKPYSHIEVLSEFRTSKDRSRGLPDSERILLEVREPQSNHNGGAVAFGPDGFLYVPFGDGGGAGDTGFGHAEDWYDENEGGNGQDVTENFLGSLLRIDVDSRTDGKPYGIPDDNPLVGKRGHDELYAWGFRNPWRIGFSHGQLFVADVGQALFEEVNIVEKGGNYGWNVREGTHCFNPKDPLDPPKECPTHTPPDVRGGEPLLDPIIEYPHVKDGESIGNSVVGGFIYEGTVAALRGEYVFGDYREIGDTVNGALFAATPADEGLWSFVELEIEGRKNGDLNDFLISIGRDNDGELYILTAGDDGGAVQKIVPSRKTNNTTAEAVKTTAENGSDGEETTTSTDGAGFGVFVALAGLATVAAARLLGDD